MKLTRREAAGALTSVLGLAQANPLPAHAATPREVHAVWAGAGDAGTTVDSVRAFVAQLKRANIHKVVMGVKEGNGSVVWHSKRLPQLISPRYQDFDLVEHLVREAHDQGIEVHAWLIDFYESQNGAAYREHPEWAQLNAEGKATNSEKLFDRDKLPNQAYPSVWMCPARWPGYTDQWLLPLIEELVSTYRIDGIHHDYVRYAGDVAPDSYCFCDYCLKNIPRHALLHWESGLGERQQVDIVRPRVEANWEATPDMLPAGWEAMNRRAQFRKHPGPRVRSRQTSPFRRARPIHRLVKITVPAQTGKPAQHIRRDVQRLAHLARRAAPRESDDVRRHGRAARAVAAVDFLNHALAPVAAGQVQINVRPGTFSPLGEKPLEQSIKL